MICLKHVFYWYQLHNPYVAIICTCFKSVYSTFLTITQLSEYSASFFTFFHLLETCIFWSNKIWHVFFLLRNWIEILWAHVLLTPGAHNLISVCLDIPLCVCLFFCSSVFLPNFFTGKITDKWKLAPCNSNQSIILH